MSKTNQLFMDDLNAKIDAYAAAHPELDPLDAYDEAMALYAHDDGPDPDFPIAKD